jgi:hypothetical protein
MSGRFECLRPALLALVCAPLLVAQATLPAATPLRAYDKGFREPVRLATDTQGRLYVADPRLGLITVRDEAGKLLTVKRGLAKPLGVAVDASGRIFVCEAGRGRVSIFTPAWTPAGALGQGDGEFQMPNHLQITADGSVYVVDSGANQVKVYGPSLQPTLQFGAYGTLDGQFDFPTGLAVASTGEILVSDQGNERIQVFDASGAFLRKFGGKLGMIGTNTTFGRVQGLLADGQGRIYLADAFRGVITVVTPTGTKLGTLGSYGSDPGQLAGPASLALDRHNRLFVAAPGNSRVEVFGLDTYTDPHILSARLDVSPTSLTRASATQGTPGWRSPARGGRAGRPDDIFVPQRRQLVSVLIKIPGVAPSAIQESTVTANGLTPTRVPGAFIGDFDGDGNLEFRAWFDQERLLATLPNGEAFLVVSGRLSDGQTFESIADLTVLPPTGGAQ